MNTYHIYFDGQCLFKNLTENEFDIIYGKKSIVPTLENVLHMK